MSVMNMITNTGFILGIGTAIVSTFVCVTNMFKKVSIRVPVVMATAGILMMVPFLLCEYHGAEYVETEDVLIYARDDKYITIHPDGMTSVWVKYGEDYYTQETVHPKKIKVIEDGSEPRLQLVTTYRRFSIFETSNQVCIIWIPYLQ